MRRRTPEEIAWHDRVTAQRAARRAEVIRQVADNWTERSTGPYEIPGRAVGQSDEAAARAREQIR